MLVWKQGKKLQGVTTKVKSIVDHVMNLLSFTDYKRCRNVNIGKEIIKWRALLRHSRYNTTLENT